MSAYILVYATWNLYVYTNNRTNPDYNTWFLIHILLLLCTFLNINEILYSVPKEPSLQNDTIFITISVETPDILQKRFDILVYILCNILCQICRCRRDQEKFLLT